MMLSLPLLLFSFGIACFRKGEPVFIVHGIVLCVLSVVWALRMLVWAKGTRP